MEIDKIVKVLPTLTEAQLFWIHEMVKQFSKLFRFDATITNLFSERLINDFGDTLRVHHCFSKQAFTCPASYHFRPQKEQKGEK